MHCNLSAIVAIVAALASASFVVDHAQAPKQPEKILAVHGRGHVEPKTPAEKAARLALHLEKFHAHKEVHKKLRAMPLPASWDSRTKGWIPPIVDQGQCGSCWAFSGIAVCTVAYMVAPPPTGPPGALSEQFVLDCGQNGGCDGDDNTTVLAQAKATGVPTTAQYGPYQGQRGKCKSSGLTLHKLKDWGFCTPSNTNAPADVDDICSGIMTYGFVGFGIDASSEAFNNYTSGVFTAPPSTNIDHDVGAVAFRFDPSAVTAANPKGCILTVRNSWGTGWGMKGYMDIAYGSAGVGWEAVWGISPYFDQPGPTPPTPPNPSSPTFVQISLTDSTGAVSTYLLSAPGSVIGPPGSAVVSKSMSIGDFAALVDSLKTPREAPALRLPAGPSSSTRSALDMRIDAIDMDMREVRGDLRKILEKLK